MRLRTQLIIEDTVMQRIDEIAGEKHLRAKIVDKALREYIERYDAARPKKKAKPPTDPKEKAKAAAIAKAKKAVRARA